MKGVINLNKEQALNLIIQVILTRATGTSQEIDAWREALKVIQTIIVPLPKETVNKIYSS